MHIHVLLISKCEWYVENLVTDMYYNNAYVQRKAQYPFQISPKLVVIEK